MTVETLALINSILIALQGISIVILYGLIGELYRRRP